MTAALHVFNHVMEELLAGLQATDPPMIISKSTLECATALVQHLKTQKEGRRI